MKLYLVIAVIASLLFSCRKDNDAAGIPDGIWVDKARPADTLLIYRENGKNVLFDKSDLYRATMGAQPANESYKWKYRLVPGKVQIKMYAQAAENYYSYDFAWNVEGKEFSMQANAIRPYLSSTLARLVYEKVR